MPKKSVYVSRRDEALLDSLPEGLTVAELLRRGLREWERNGAECAHAHLVMMCSDCGLRRPVNPSEREETAGEGDAHPVSM